MMRTGDLLHTYKGSLAGVEVRFSGSTCARMGNQILVNGTVQAYFPRAQRIPKNVRRCGIKSWEIDGGRGIEGCISITCDMTAGNSGKLTVAKLCGTCSQKTLFVSINGKEKKHIYSIHPVKDSQIVRRWWIDTAGVLQIRTWPWSEK